MTLASQHNEFDVQKIRAQFPALQQTIHGKPLIYLDNAATTQKPQAVLDALLHYYQYDNANVHRSIHTLADRATEALEVTRKHVQQFIHAAEPEEIIFTAGTTAGINLVASSYGQKFVQAGDEVIISHMEHHANIVPWQMLCQAKGATLRVIPISDTGELTIPAFEELLTPKTKVVAVNYVSNTLGTINPIQELITKAHAQGAVVVVDAAQAAPHLTIDVQDLDCDFLAFSAHKAYGPTGVGVLYGKSALLASMPPYQGGGEMIREVTLDKTTYNDIPYKFEAGTPNIADIIAFRAALVFISEVGQEVISKHEDQLLNYAHNQLSTFNKIRLIGTALHKIGVISFVIEGMHHLDAGMLLDAQGIAVRTGHGCTQPLMHRFGVGGVIRASFAIYNTMEEVEQFVAAVAKITQQS
ncbi:MAG: SufS family cysteine desulfurase [Bacteroidota bacterium]